MLCMIGREITAGTRDAIATLARSVDARRILEVGTGYGDVTLALAATLPADGLLITMEPDPSIAAAARQRFAAAGFGHQISVIVGEPARFLHKIRGPFDVIVHRASSATGAFGSRLAAMLRAGGILIEGDTKYSVKNMTIAEWLAHAKADAEKRGLPELIPMLDGLAQATERLRGADWNDNPDTVTPADDDDQ
jgi:predicted O-methyltransferase YrrM